MTRVTDPMIRGLYRAVSDVATEIGLSPMEEVRLAGALREAVQLHLGRFTAEQAVDAIPAAISGAPWATRRLRQALARTVGAYLAAAQEEMEAGLAEATLSVSARTDRLRMREEQERRFDEQDEAAYWAAADRLTELEDLMQEQHDIMHANRTRIRERAVARRAEQKRIDTLAAREQSAAEAVSA